MSSRIAPVQGRSRALNLIAEQVDAATGAPKCHSCGCFHSTVTALETTELGRTELTETLARARASFVEKEYDCLGCPVCYPALAANALTDAHPELAGAFDACPTDLPNPRAGWPALPGNYHVVRYRAPVAVCTLNSEELETRLAREAPDGLAIVGTLHTENLGIERLLQNVLGNPNIRFLIVCGEDTEQAVGHLPGQSLASLFENGLDDRGRIVGARGKRPVIKNVSREQVEAFVQRVELVDAIGVMDTDRIVRELETLAARPRTLVEASIGSWPITTTLADEPRRLIPDPAGYFVVYPDAQRSKIVVEHYSNDGVLGAVIEGRTPASVYSTAIEQKLLSRLDHAAYLGRELARAEQSLSSGERYVQDRAAGEILDQGSCCEDSSCKTPS